MIAEKKKAAQEIGRAMIDPSINEQTQLPIRGNGFVITACSGHILELVPPEDINEDWGKPWREEVLPIYIPNWPKRPVEDKTWYLDTIERLLSEAQSVIHAGDPDDEGQLIVDEVLDYLGYTGKVERVYVNDSIDKNIRKAFERLVPNDQCRRDGVSAYARQMGDFCFGINETRLPTIRLKRFLTEGRVQIQTLALVVKRDLARLNHEKRIYFDTYAECGDSMRFKFVPDKEVLGEEKYLFEDDIPIHLKEALTGKTVDVSVVIEEKKSNPPLPYNMTYLLADMNDRFGYSLEETQDITQVLKDKYNAITYNRSTSRYLKDEHYIEAPDVLAVAMKNIGASWELDFAIKGKVFNDKNCTSHHGIIPTEQAIDVTLLTEKERIVYTSIVERYAMQFCEPEKAIVSVATFTVDQGVFQHTAKRVLDPGYKGQFEPNKSGSQKDDAGWLDEGTYQLKVDSVDICEKTTTPPKAYTLASLVLDMASFAKYVKDPEIKKIMLEKDKNEKDEHGGIGTAATRKDIIKKLFEMKYIEDVSGKVISTELGRKFYALIPDVVKSMDTTARWWLLQQAVAEGNADVNAIQESVIEVFNSHKDTSYLGVDFSTTTSVGTCPVCGKDVVSRGKTYSCISNKSVKQEDGTWARIEGCGFVIYPIAGKTITVPQVSKMLGTGKTDVIQGFKSKKSGEKFSARLVMGKDGEITFEFPQKKKSTKNRTSAQKSYVRKGKGRY